MAPHTLQHATYYIMIQTGTFNDTSKNIQQYKQDYIITQARIHNNTSKNMRAITFTIAMLALTAACTTARLTDDQKAQQAALTAQSVRKAIDGKYFTIDIRQMTPQRFPTKTVEFGYSLHVSGDSIYSYLPYIGRAYNAPYGGGDGLNFKGTLTSYAVKKRVKDCTVIELKYNNSEESYTYMVSIYDNGKSTINVLPRERDKISFEGEMNLDR